MQQSSLPGFEPTPSTGDSHRLFFALWPDEATRARMAEAAASLRAQHCPGGRWIKPHRYHLTLQFLGNHTALPDDLVEQAIAAAGEVSVAAFDLILDCAGSFRNNSIPWWLGCLELPEPLYRLWQAIGVSLRKRGIVSEKSSRLVPHVTVLRDASAPLPSAPIAPIVWPIAEFVLIHSRLGARSEYALLHRWPLRT